MWDLEAGRAQKHFSNYTWKYKARLTPGKIAGSPGSFGYGWPQVTEGDTGWLLRIRRSWISRGPSPLRQNVDDLGIADNS